MNTNKKGFTLVELIVTMAIYSILFVIISMTVVSLSRLNNTFIKGNSYDEVIKIDKFITDQFKESNGSIIFNNESLFEIGTTKVKFINNSLVYESENIITVAKHSDITSITRKIEHNKIIFEITYGKETKSIVLFNVGGNI